MRLSYGDGYFEDDWQVMPKAGFTDFLNNMLNHENITIELNQNAKNRLRIADAFLHLDGERLTKPVVYTGALDELFDYQYGELPYRALRFEWHEKECGFQPAPVTAYPQEKGYTRITDYTKLPEQNCAHAIAAVEYPLQHQAGKTEPYYPVLTEESIGVYTKYATLAKAISNLHLCGRLADFKYYNMDTAVERGLRVWERI